MFSKSGFVDLCRADNFGYLGAPGGLTGDRFGAAIDGTRDFDGDGTNDLVIGAPNWSASGSSQNGRVYVLSGARLFAQTSPYDLFAPLQFAAASAGVANLHLGTSVCASADLNGDGVPDILAGGPGYFTSVPPLPERGIGIVYSGATGMRISSVVGATSERLGDAALGVAFDLNSDGFPDFAFAGSTSDVPSSDCGSLKFCSLFPSSPSAYCTSMINSLGCTPMMSWSGQTDYSAASPFSIRCLSVINQTSGLFFYSHAPKAVPFQGGTLCVQAPLRRSPVLQSGGNSSGSDCSGVFSWDFAARIASGVDPSLVPGADIYSQCWSRDSASPSTINLSNALRFLINP